MQRREDEVVKNGPYMFALKTSSPFSANQVASMEEARDRWGAVIVEGVGTEPDSPDLAIEVMTANLGSPGATYASSEITSFWEDGHPRTAVIRLEKADLAALEARQRLQDIICHEMGHCLGFGVLWVWKKLLAKENEDIVFAGQNARREYSVLLGHGPNPNGPGVPVEVLGPTGQRYGHWRESVFGRELMTTALPSPANPLSRLTVASLADLGYAVEPDAADPFELE